MHRIVDERSIARWDTTVDVLVAGLGCAGATAAIEAARSGAETMILERASGGGGTTAMSGAVIYCGGGTALQRACGFDDTTEDMYRYLCASTGIAPNAEKLQRYCEDSPGHFDWLVSLGIPFKASFWPHSFEPYTDDGLYFSGCEQNHPFTEIARPAPRGHVVQSPGSCTGGRKLMDILEREAVKAGACVSPDTAIEGLVKAADGRVLGAVVRRDGEFRSIRARRGVILTTGGFVLNRDMVGKYAPQLLDLEPLASAWDDGTGIELGQLAGGDTLHMDAGSYPCAILQPPELIQGILLNAHGQRFINEDVNHKRIGENCVLHQGGKMYLLLDNDIFAQPQLEKPEVIATGETIAEVEAELGLPEMALQHTVAFYNHHAARGVDPLFGKQAKHLKPLTSPPFGVFDCSVGKVGIYRAFTLGGLRTLVTGEVLDPTGAAIPGLYAAGRTTSGLSAQSCAGSGAQIGEGTYFGRLAGCAAALA
jgi:succinate dehydrogenase/fumarate reductase flavoprotein subunit